VEEEVEPLVECLFFLSATRLPQRDEPHARRPPINADAAAAAATAAQGLLHYEQKVRERVAERTVREWPVWPKAGRCGECVVVAVAVRE
jgi:hypothetical protein